MTIGIYSLKFTGLEDWVYVGQSSNIERRLKTHKYSLQSNIANYKMQGAYIISTEFPVLTIIEECSIKDLDILEAYWIRELDSVHNGLNILHIAAGVLARGELNSRSKYSNERIIEAFEFICSNHELSCQQIADSVNVSFNVVKTIREGVNHTWLKEVHPHNYEIMVNSTLRTNSAKKMGIVYPDIISPEGIVYHIDNLQKFSREHDLNNSSLHQVLTGKRKTVSKWRLAA